MGVLRFTSSGSNRVKWTTLASNLADVSDGAWTFAVGIKRATDDGVFHGYGYLLSGAGDGTVEAGTSVNGTDQLVADSIDSNPASALTITGTSEHYFVVVSKPAGPGDLTYSKYEKSLLTWQHDIALGVDVPDQIDATMLELGAWQNGDFFDGWMPVAALWEGEMSEAHKEDLVLGWQTSDLYNSSHGTPQFLVEGNVTGASLVDLIGNASSLAVTGTSLDAGETFDSWNFDGTGVAAPTVPAFVAHRLVSPGLTPGLIGPGSDSFAMSTNRGSRGIFALYATPNVGVAGSEPAAGPTVKRLPALGVG